jgi:hypothetical protein
MDDTLDFERMAAGTYNPELRAVSLNDLAHSEFATAF